MKPSLGVWDDGGIHNLVFSCCPFWFLWPPSPAESFEVPSVATSAIEATKVHRAIKALEDLFMRGRVSESLLPESLVVTILSLPLDRFS